MSNEKQKKRSHSFRTEHIKTYYNFFYVSADEKFKIIL
jgi:hypothetical protein